MPRRWGAASDRAAPAVGSRAAVVHLGAAVRKGRLRDLAQGDLPAALKLPAEGQGKPAALAAPVHPEASRVRPISP